MLRACVTGFVPVDIMPSKAQLMSTNFLAYCNLVELTTRTQYSSLTTEQLLCVCDLVEITSYLGEGGAQQLFTSSQIVKAYVSAVATWLKAFKMRLTEPPTAAAEAGSAGAAAGGAAAAGGGAAAAGSAAAGPAVDPAAVTELVRPERINPLIAKVMVMLRATPQPDNDHGSSSEEYPSLQEAKAASPWGQAYWTMQLAVLWWLSHAVAALLQLLLLANKQKVAGFEQGSSSSSKNIATVTAMAADQSCSSSSSQGAGIRTSSSSDAARTTRDTNDRGSNSSSPGSPRFCAATESLSIMESFHAAAMVGKLLVLNTDQWDARARTEQTPEEGRSAGPAATAVPNDIQQLLPKRMFSLPRQGMPAAVAEKVELLAETIPNVFELRKLDVQLQMLQDALKLCQVLQQEVPCPIGCNNPRCVDLKGVSEVAASCKTCTGCGVARYCSRECQVGHWKEHRRACRRVEKGYNG